MRLRVVRRILRPVRHGGRDIRPGVPPACGGRLRRRSGLGGRRLLRQKAVERGQIR